MRKAMALPIIVLALIAIAFSGMFLLVFDGLNYLIERLIPENERYA